MTINLLQTPEYTKLMKNHIVQTIQYFFDKEQEFAIACEIAHVTFVPDLPREIQDTFQETVLFMITGYSFETAKVTEEYFTFDAGFGSEDFEATVSIPLLAMKQIFLGENPIVLNLAKYEKRERTSTKLSMEALLKNPENKKLLKRRK